jgi:hypothetical protein
MITVVNFIAQYLRTSLPNATEWTDAVLGYWIDAALLDISRSFPRKSYAYWASVAGTQQYLYADSLGFADETNTIRFLDCIYPAAGTAESGPKMSLKSHTDEDFLGGDYYEADNEAQKLFIGASLATGLKIRCNAHVYWKVAAGVIGNPDEHNELIRLFCIWQAFLHQAADAASSSVPDSSLLNSLALEARRAEISYAAAYQKLAEAKATSIYTNGYSMDKWDRNIHTDGSGKTSW